MQMQPVETAPLDLSSSVSEFNGVPADKLDSQWKEIEPFIVSACKRSLGRYEAVDIYKNLANREMQLWVSKRHGEIEAVSVTEIINYPRLKVCHIKIGTGKNRKNWQHFRHYIEQWATEQGCRRVESIARKGWERIFKGYSATHIFMEKEL